MTPFTYHDVLLSIENVNLTLGGKQILRNVNAQVRDIQRPGQTTGQIIGFLGPSGVGKTKLFEIMSGLLKPTSGCVKIGTDQKPVVTGRVGVVQQHYPLFKHRTVYSNLKVAAKMCSGADCPDKKECKKCDKSVDARVMGILERFKLVPQKDHYPIQLSGGQRQRIAIAQQLLCSETFLLLDEPFSGLDPNMTAEVGSMLTEIANQREDNTIILVSHDLASTAAISDTLWVMGRDRNPDGSIVPGAYIKHNYDLAAADLAWHPGIQDDPRFLALIKELRGVFPSL